MDLERISKLIKTKRKEKNLTQEELAGKLNVTEKAISRWETKRGTPDISLLMPLAKELGITVSELLTGNESEKDNKNIQDIVNYIDITKKNKNNKVIIIASIIYIVLLLIYLWYLKTDYGKGPQITHFGELIYNTFFIIVIIFTNRYIANNYYDTQEERNKINKITYIMILIVYLIMLFNMTIYGREIYETRYNLIPFKTIINYLTYPDSYNISVNLFGNIIIMMPIEFLLIKIFNINKFKNNLFINIIIVFLIEFLQLITHSGVFDIDDIILNMLGMIIMYYLINGKHKILYKLKDFIITSFLSCIIVQFSIYYIDFFDYYIHKNIAFIRLIGLFTLVEIILYLILILLRKRNSK